MLGLRGRTAGMVIEAVVRGMIDVSLSGEYHVGTGAVIRSACSTKGGAFASSVLYTACVYLFSWAQGTTTDQHDRKHRKVGGPPTGRE